MITYMRKLYKTIITFALILKGAALCSNSLELNHPKNDKLI